MVREVGQAFTRPCVFRGAQPPFVLLRHLVA